MKNRRGKINISYGLLENATEEEFREIFSNFFPIIIRDNIFGIRTYYGFSPLFREIESSEEPPLYNLILTQKDGKLLPIKIIEDE